MASGTTFAISAHEPESSTRGSARPGGGATGRFPEEDEMTAPGEDETTRRLLAREEIRELKARYFRCLDGRDWTGLRAVFTDDAAFDMRAEVAALRAEGVDLPAEAGLVQGGEAIVASVARGLEGLVTVHQGHMPEIALHSDTAASGVWLLEDILRMPPDSPVAEVRGYGRYYEDYTRVGGAWRIARLAFVRTLKYVTARDGRVTVSAPAPVSAPGPSPAR